MTKTLTHYRCPNCESGYRPQDLDVPEAPGDHPWCPHCSGDEEMEPMCRVACPRCKNEKFEVSEPENMHAWTDTELLCVECGWEGHVDNKGVY